MAEVELAWVFWPPLEFFVFLSLLGQDSSEAGDTSLIHPARAQIIAEARAKLSTFLIQEVKEFFWPLAPGTLYGEYFTWAWKSYPEAKSVAEVIVQIEQGGPRNTLLLLADAFGESQDAQAVPNAHHLFDSSRTDLGLDPVRQYVADHWAGESRQRMGEYLLHPGETHDRVVYAMRRVYLDGYCH